MEELAAFGALCLIALVIYFILVSMSAKDKKDKDNIDLAKYMDNPPKYIDPSSYDDKKLLRRQLLTSKGKIKLSNELFHINMRMLSMKFLLPMLSKRNMNLMGKNGNIHYMYVWKTVLLFPKYQDFYV